MSWIAESFRNFFSSKERRTTEQKRADEQLRAAHGELARSQGLLQALLEKSPSSICIKDVEGRYLLVNRQWLKDLDVDEEKVIGRTDFEIFPEQIAKTWLEEHRYVLETGEVLEKEDELRGADGVHTFMTHVFTLLDESGAPYAICVISTEISERKQTEEALRRSEEKYRLLIEGLRDEYIFFTYAQDGVINYVSPSVENVLGYSPSHFTEHFVEFLTDNPINESAPERARRTLEGEHLPATVRELRHKDGSVRLMEISTFPLFGEDGTVNSVEGIGRDVTKKIEAENVLTNAHTRMKRDLEAAAVIQRSLLPAVLPNDIGIAFSWRYRPCDELGGDLLNIFRITDRHIGLYVLDVSGHGVPSALLSIAVARSLSPSAREGSVIIDVDPHGSEVTVVNPAEVARRLNGSHSMADFGGLMFTMQYGVLDLERRTLSFVSAGHPDPIRSTPKRGAALIRSVGGPPIGVTADADYQELTIDLANADRVYFISDGMYEQTNEEGTALGLNHLRELINGYHSDDIAVATEGLLNDVLRWSKSGHLRDDVSVLAFQFDA